MTIGCTIYYGCFLASWLILYWRIFCALLTEIENKNSHLQRKKTPVFPARATPMITSSAEEAPTTNVNVVVNDAPLVAENSSNLRQRR